MKDLNTKEFDEVNSKDISFLQIIEMLLKSKSIIFLSLLLSIFIGITYSYSIDNIYLSSFTSEIKNIENDSFNPSGEIFQGILGINEDSSLKKIVNQVKSKDFFQKLLENSEFVELAGLSKDDSFDKNHHLFINSKLFFKEYPQSQSLELGILDTSPERAFSMVKILLDLYNIFSKERDILEARKENEFLMSQLSSTNVPELRVSISNLIKINLKTLALSETSDFYNLKILDSPRIPNFKFSPNRVIILLGFIVTSLTFCFIIIFFYSLKGKYISFSLTKFRFSLEDSK
tara:strand:- start:440 stop:1306 length:867 start_codon:yes stop_codon:yes gene_type:complete